METIFAEMRRYAEQNSIPILLTETETLLKLMTSVKRPKKILEIGTAIGYSAAVMLSCDTQSKIYTIEIDEDRYTLAKQYLTSANLINRAKLFLGDAGELLSVMTGSYDMIFLDGPKGQYIKILPYLKELLAESGLLVCDNVLFRGLVEKTNPVKKESTMVNNLREFLVEIKNDSDFITSVLNVGDGVALCYKK